MTTLTEIWNKLQSEDDLECDDFEQDCEQQSEDVCEGPCDISLYQAIKLFEVYSLNDDDFQKSVGNWLYNGKDEQFSNFLELKQYTLLPYEVTREKEVLAGVRTDVIIKVTEQDNIWKCRLSCMYSKPRFKQIL